LETAVFILQEHTPTDHISIFTQMMEAKETSH